MMKSPHQALSAVQPLALMAALLCVAAAATACGGGPVKIPSQPMPPGVSDTGDWYSEQFNNMRLDQKGTQVTGTFAYKEGTLEGTLDGNVLYFKWVQPGDKEKARPEVSGNGYFVISANGSALEGRWGYNEDNAEGGKWTAQRIDTSGPREDFDAPIFN